jgi:hypothetical protein
MSDDYDSGWERTSWWRVLDENGVWAESSDEHEVRSRTRPGDRIQVLMRRTEERWEDAD